MFTATYTGLVNGDTPASMTSPPSLTTAANESSPVGTYPITATGAVNSNYTISYAAGTLVIERAATLGLLSSSQNPTTPGEMASFSLMLKAAPPGVGFPSGLVQFVIDDATAGEPISLKGGTAVLTTSNLTHGVHNVAIQYSGDGNFTGTTNTLAPAQLINTQPVPSPLTLERALTNCLTIAIETLLTNCHDADGDPIMLAGLATSTAKGGVVVTNGSWIVYTPPAGITNSDVLTYSITDGFGTPVTGTVTVNLRAEVTPPPTLSLAMLPNGLFRVQGNGLPGRTYRIQFATDPGSVNWETLSDATADSAGNFEFIDTSKPSTRFYRAICPPPRLGEALY